ncbi:MAG: YezD family protein [Treponema sp.]|nr:YezD family protein [Treponema sp.]
MGTENNKTGAVLIKKSSTDDIKKVEELIKNIKFGSVTIHVEDARIVQVDKNEKIRFR